MIFIMRGIPGSGKSYHAKTLTKRVHYIVSADQCFVDNDGVYRFDHTKIGEAHQGCFRSFIRLAQQFDVDVVVDNTNIRLWELSPYVLAGEAHGHAVELVHVRCDVEKAIARNTHGVPEVVIRRMAEQFEAPLPHWTQRMIEND